MASKSSSAGGNWVTINGVHVLIGANGKITKGPAKFIGSTVDDLKGSKKSVAERKAELQKKKQQSSTSKKTDKKESPKKSTEKKTTPSNNSSAKNNTQESAKSDIVKKLQSSGSATMTQKGDWGNSTTKITKLKDGEYSVVTTTQFGNGSPVKDRQVFTSSEKAAGYASKNMSLDDPYRIGGSKSTSTKVVNKDIDSRPVGSSNKRLTMVDDGKTSKIVMSSNTPKYPSGVTTPAQKKAYTQAINNGKTSSEATKVAKNVGKTTTTQTTVQIAGFTKSQNARLQKLVNSGMKPEEAASKVLSSSGGYNIFRGGRGFR